MQGLDYALGRDLKNKYLLFSLNDLPYYTTKINLQGLPLTLTVEYNTRNKCRSIVITDNSGTPLLPQTFIKHEKRCEMNFVSNQYDLNYFVSLEPRDKTKVFSATYDYLDWSKDFDLIFVGYRYSLVERLEVNRRKLKVGN